jgi:hypothetical protein
MPDESKSIDNTEDVIDSRDVIARIDYLDSLAEDGLEFDDVDVRELHALQALQDQASDYAEDWQYGVALIRDSYFVTYAQELADEIVEPLTDRDQHWPFTCIDWEKAARELRMDYASVDFDGVTYWVR